ncbi:TAXI family TRAP transporter solute-binding subunit [uncultured Succinivibrio sp.]|uniref:TAXI family TRAP transporter solute-binding subunit n=1 Tax=uncultured Succinivibrio sp. TaxID=540749 RepID=UPI0025F1BC93|nr:TAXI family TRAP transporter solute-binding subunit [uncultured Succinivibrio sp.]
MKKLLTLLLCAGILTGCSDEDKNVLRVGVGEPGSGYEAYVATLNDQLESNQSSIRLKPVYTKNSGASVRLLNYVLLDLSVIEGSALDIALKNETEETSAESIGRFTDKSYNILNDGDEVKENFATVASVYDKTLHIVIMDDSLIDELTDIYSSNLIIGSDDSYSKHICEHVFSTNSKKNDINLNNFTDIDNALEMLKEKKADVAFIFDRVPSDKLLKFSKENKVRMMSLPRTKIQELVSSDTCFSQREISADTYPDIGIDIRTLDMEVLMVASIYLENNTVSELLKNGILGNKTLNKEESKKQLLHAGKTLHNIGFHEGAHEFFKENGVDVKATNVVESIIKMNLIAGQD